MDNLTHTLSGLALAQTGLSRTTRGATAALLIGSNIPDVDIVFGLAGNTAYLQHHRDFTHSVLGAPLLALFLAVALRLALKGSFFLRLFACTGLAIAGHVLMDLWTSYGTRVLSPFDRSWYAWDIVFILDPLILLVLVTTLVVGRRRRPRLVAALGLALMSAYVGARAWLHHQAIKEAYALAPIAHPMAIAALPSPIDPLSWRILVDTGPSYLEGDLKLGRPSLPLSVRLKRKEDAAVFRARTQSETAAIFLEAARFPWLEVATTTEGTEVTWTDLRYEKAGRRFFVARIVVAPDGRIRSQSFHF